MKQKEKGYVTLMLLVLIAFGFLLTGGLIPLQPLPNTETTKYALINPPKIPVYKTLQMQALTCDRGSLNSYDIELIIDRSGSMEGSFGQVKDAANKFVDIISANTENRIALVSYSEGSTIDVPFTNNFSSLKSAVNGLQIGGRTCIECAMNKANAELTAHGRVDKKKVVIFLTDGVANRTETLSADQVSTAQAEAAAITVVRAMFAAQRTTIFPIGLGDVNAAFLQQIATMTSGNYYLADNASQLAEIYSNISLLIGAASGCTSK